MNSPDEIMKLTAQEIMRTYESRITQLEADVSTWMVKYADAMTDLDAAKEDRARWRAWCTEVDTGTVVDEIEFGYRLVKLLRASEARNREHEQREAEWMARDVNLVAECREHQRTIEGLKEEIESLWRQRG